MNLSWFLATIPIVLKNAGNSFINLLPYVLSGVLLSEILKFTSWTKLIYKWVSRSPVISTFAAVILGIVSPLCTYGTIPIVLQLYKTGVSIAPLMAFLSASSLMNPQLFIVTWGGINAEMALVRVLVVFIFCMILGFILYKIPERFIVKPNIAVDTSGVNEIKARPKKKFELKKFLLVCWDNLKFVGFYIVIGVIIGSIVETYIPANWIMNAFKPGRVTSVLFAALLGVPLYACGGGAIPFVNSLLAQGMNKGSALAFFIVGPATRITPLMALAVFIRPLFILAYAVFLVIFSVLVGLIY